MRAVGMLSLLALLPSCDPDAKACRDNMASAQAIVTKVDPKSQASVQESLTAVTAAHAACEKAKLGDEREQLLKAKNELTAQLNLLEARARRKKLQAPTPEELAELIKSGDPTCPKGQAYKPQNSKSEVRCTGAQIADMNAEQLKAYYGDRKFKVTETASPAEIRAEHGAELYRFAFDKLTDPAPRCVTAFAPTGTAPEKLKLNAPVRSGRGELEFKVEHETDQPTVHLGNCAPPG